jgi:predicted metal-dependent hydrolase
MTDLPVDVIRSRRRTRTAQAYEAGGRLRVLIPAHLSESEEAAVVEDLVGKVTRKLTSKTVDLETRAREVARKYGLHSPSTIVWSNRQNSRWGSCSPREGKIRISSRLATMPDWVLDWVLVHELAHLEVANHGERFKLLVGRYELGERAEGYLIAKSEGTETTPHETCENPSRVRSQVRVEGVARIRVAGVEAGLEPLLALLG